MIIDNETIAALSTPPGKGGIAVIRISGPETRTLLNNILEKLPAKTAAGKDLPKPRRAFHDYIIDKTTGKKWDECILVFFKGPKSYTGEDMAEISVHGNPFIVEAVLGLITRQGVRPALPGEFTYRAYQNGKMDLIQAESVNQLINANSEVYARVTFGSLEGRLSKLLETLKDHLVQLGIKIETKIEFEEDQYFDEITISKELNDSLVALEKILANSRFNEVWNKGLNIVLAGKVNVGKSSLFNALLLEERSIISHIPGTTRDFIKEKFYIDGLPIEITDVAGINQDTQDEIEHRGVQRTLDKIANSDAVIFLLDASRPLEQADFDIYQIIEKKQKLIVINKIDIADPSVTQDIHNHFASTKAAPPLEISVKKDSGIDNVREFIKSLAGNFEGKAIDFAVNNRQKKSLEKLHQVLTTVSQMIAEEDSASGSFSSNAEIAAEEIRRAIEIIGELLGEITPDDILNQIFSQFCVGK